VFLVALPIRRPHHWVGHTARIGEGYAVLRLDLESGIVGWGETQVIATWGGDHGARYGEAPSMTATALREVLLPAIAGCNVTEIEELHARMNRALRGYPYAKAAVDVAAHDAVGALAVLGDLFQIAGQHADDLVDLGLAFYAGIGSLVARIADEVLAPDQFQQARPMLGIGTAGQQVDVIVGAAGLARVDAAGRVVGRWPARRRLARVGRRFP